MRNSTAITNSRFSRRITSLRPGLAGPIAAIASTSEVASTARLATVALVIALFASAAVAPAGFAQCPAEPPLQNYTGGGTTGCPCFITGEQAGVVLTAPPSHYPLEILRIGIGWGSIYNANPPQVEQAVKVYAGGLPNPGVPIFTLAGPQLTDGFTNEYNIEPIPGEVVIASGPFTVALEFLSSNASDFFASSVVHDGNGCQAGKNVVYAAPGVWADACALGVSGDWVMYVIYRPCTATGVGDTRVLSSTPSLLRGAYPNPFTASTQIEFFLDSPQRASIGVYDLAGRRVARVADEYFDTGAHTVGWNGRSDAGESMPTGIYFVRLEAGETRSVKKVVLMK